MSALIWLGLVLYVITFIGFFLKHMLGLTIHKHQWQHIEVMSHPWSDKKIVFICPECGQFRTYDVRDRAKVAGEDKKHAK